MCFISFLFVNNTVAAPSRMDPRKKGTLYKNFVDISELSEAFGGERIACHLLKSQNLKKRGEFLRPGPYPFSRQEQC